MDKKFEDLVQETEKQIADAVDFYEFKNPKVDSFYLSYFIFCGANNFLKRAKITARTYLEGILLWIQ